MQFDKSFQYQIRYNILKLILKIKFNLFRKYNTYNLSYYYYYYFLLACLFRIIKIIFLHKIIFIFNQLLLCILQK